MKKQGGKNMKYGVAFYKEEKAYSVFLVDYDAATCGENLEDARSMAKELLELYIETEGAKKETQKEVDLEKLYFERTGKKAKPEDYETAHLEYIEL